ncbi:substrate-binding domain-containing protein [Microlunatus sp. GCM10028923]|uniref:substrate-binding domain-containing protein n=1 Tax=Microlunatus sp. GCM10028923 TaxID=3273400 RepID=UPI003618018E
MPKPLPGERREQLRKQLDLRGVVRTAELSARLGVSERTLQRDLDALVAAGAARRVHGGAVRPATAETTARLRLGLVVPTRAYYYEEIVDGVVEAAAALNAQVIIGTYDYDEELETALLRRVTDLDLDGLLVTVEYDSVGYARLRSSAAPVVLIERPLLPPLAGAGPRPAPIDHVCSDHGAGVLLGLDHLAELGHRSVCCLIRRTPTAAGLLRGLSRVAAAPGAPVEVIIRELDRAAPPLDDGDPLLADLLAGIGSGTITAALVHTDHDALAVHRALTAAGVAVPDQLSLLSYDDVIIKDSAVPLSALAPQRRWIGRLACETLVDRIRRAGRRFADRPPVQLSLAPELVLRGSTAPVSGPGPR